MAPYQDQEVILKLKFALIIILVLALGLLAVNQTLEYFYKAQFLKSPCSLCEELNPGVTNQGYDTIINMNYTYAPINPDMKPAINNNNQSPANK